MATMVNKGDVAWMLVSAALVLMMSIPRWRCSTAAWCA
jgi:Amt family ammonium transporter